MDKQGNKLLPNGIIEVEKQFYSRLVYCNPVCLLSTPSNVMTISWLTPINNKGDVIFSMNKRRHTAKILQDQEHPGFVLNLPVKGMESLVTSIGGCHGSQVNKFESLKIDTCPIGWGESKLEGRYEENLLALKNCVAHIACKVNKIDADSDDEHLILHAVITSGFVKADYWSGKQIYPQDTSLPGLLTFLGSGKFAEMVPIP